MVLSGIYEDKAEIGAIGEWAGVAEFHRKINMDAEEVRESVNKILNDDSFKRKARELADVYRAYDPVKRLDAILEERIKWFDAKTAGEKKVNRDEL